MNILFLTPRFPYPLDRGDKIRPYHFARVLAKHHKLSLLSFLHDEERDYVHSVDDLFDQVDVVPLTSWQTKRNMLLHVAGTKPLLVCGWTSMAMRDKLDGLLARNRFDIVYVYGLRMSQYIDCAEGSYKVLDLCDSLALLLLRMLKHAKLYKKPLVLREWLTVRRYEQHVASQADECWFTSSVDKESMHGLSVGHKVFLIPNGVDTEYFAPGPAAAGAKDISFVGYMGVESVDAVTYFCRDVFPKVRREVPEARFRIVGANPPKQVRCLANDASISVEGYVDDLRAIYRQTAVAVAPVRFSVGVQNKVLEAMSMGIPVVATPEGNGGIGATNGKELFVCGNAGDYADAVIRLLQNESLRQRVGREARVFIQRRFRWSRVAERIEGIERERCG